MPRFRAVLFDLDGTLLNTIDDLADAMNAALERLGFPPRSVEECKFFVGDGMTQFARRALPADARTNAAIVADCVSEMRSQYSRRWNARTAPYAGIGAMLDELTARQLRLAVLSNKPHDFTSLCVRTLLGKWKFDCVQGLTDDVARKPDPSGAIAIAAALAVPPQEFMYLGDTNTDMQTAVAAGMFPVGALWGFRPAEELLSAGAKALIDHPLKLLELL